MAIRESEKMIVLLNQMGCIVPVSFTGGEKYAEELLRSFWYDEKFKGGVTILSALASVLV
ncbi:uncharacterized protein Bfra_011429 [Botrytis fragariae]|uniref:Uncharacterized protein n=1 Tax=Botrytis fragariae TaxID=1964551 RepID=A0A8H6AY52_9HELO|nr:uncharacterized protein Bfra_011429 [Botrytis fragariae]KAF5875667.1 hypothetical protein Bfra_011429 [Botrytis fragariae]